jgi:hypothetical protein
MEKLGPGDILKDVHEATEKLQKKIDKTSYLLVNSKSWEIGRQPKTLEHQENILDKDNERIQLGFKSLSETVLDLGSLPPMNGYSKDKFKEQTSWPLCLSDAVGKENDKTYESASALSLATFVSLLIEFVARLQNVVDTFEELSEKAAFEEPLFISVPTATKGV